MRGLSSTQQRIVFALAGALLVLNLASFAFGEAPPQTLARVWAGRAFSARIRIHAPWLGWRVNCRPCSVF